ncbi:hypothetical protein BDV12DRAFT_210807 [Aspergillus spectabilis]
MTTSTPKTWDFIVVGSGPSGSALASKLSLTPSKPRILLLEAGPSNTDLSLRIDGQRWTTFQQESLNWGYKTIPQQHCNGKELDYSRGKVLGGSSAINFGVYTIGARDDYEFWSESVDDEMFSWRKMQGRFKELECFDPTIKKPEHAHFANPQDDNHGSSGPLKLGFASEWEQDLPDVMGAFKDAGVEWNPDHNSGDPIGVALGINSVYRGMRSTARDLVDDALAKGGSLEVLPAKTAKRVILEGGRAVGVETLEGEIFLASKEIILSAGSLDSPKILMHSGLGPSDQLSQFNIPVKKDIPAIGQNLTDHPLAPLIFLRNPSTNTRNAFFTSQSAQDAALAQWHKDQTGPWTLHGSQIMMGWLKSDAVLRSAEFRNLPDETKEYLNKPTVPHYEVASHFPIHMLSPAWGDEYSYVCVVAFVMNGQSKGEVRLQSSDPAVPLLFNPDFLSHEYDRRVAVESIREILAVTEHESFKKDTLGVIAGPKSASEEDILEYWRGVIGSSWHMTGTVRMGRDGDEGAVVDREFRVRGVQGLRVADMSVVPVLVNGHTQAMAYVTGVTCADVLIGEYGLDQ